MLTGVVGCLNAQPVTRHAAVLSELSSAVEELCDAASPAVVQIEVRSRALAENEDDRRAGFVTRQSSSGSGVIVDPSGYIITNAHVTAGSHDIDVSVADRSDPARKDAHRHFAARLIGFDTETDLAVLKIDADKLPTLDFRDSDKLRQGQIVFALGSPLGLDNTLTVGFVSATSRQLDPEKSMTYIQTDAPINPGNSGGPLLDMDGKIAGINTMIFSRSGGSEGIGFAIPSNTVRYIYDQLRKEGHVHRGTIGVFAQDIDPVMSKALGLNRHPGVIISDVTPHSSAAAAGLEQGDIVLSIGDKPVTRAIQIQAELSRVAIGDMVTMTVLRSGEEKQIRIAVLERPKSPLAFADLVNGQSNLVRELGILATTLDARVTPSLPETRRLYGVVVAAIPEEFAAVNPGLRPGDIIYELNANKVRSLEELRAGLGALKPGDSAVVLVEHDGSLSYVPFTLQ